METTEETEIKKERTPAFRAILVIIVIIIFSLFFILMRGGEDPQQQLRFVVIPGEELTEQALYMQPVEDYLTSELGMEVDIIIATDYAAAAEALKYEHAEIAWLGPFAYLIAEKITDIEPIAASIREGKELTYQSVIFTRNDTGIETLEDIRGKTFAFNDVGSTSGYLVPMYAFSKLGMNPEEDFAEVTFAGSHMASQLAVYNGQVDAGASNLPTYEKLVEAGQIDSDIQKIIWYSDPIPSNPIVMRTNLDPELKGKIQKAFLTMDSKMGTFQGPGNKKFEGFGRVESSDYDVLREMAKALNLDLSKID